MAGDFALGRFLASEWLTGSSGLVPRVRPVFSKPAILNAGACRGDISLTLHEI